MTDIGLLCGKHAGIQLSVQAVPPAAMLRRDVVCQEWGLHLIDPNLTMGGGRGIGLVSHALTGDRMPAHQHLVCRNDTPLTCKT